MALSFIGECRKFPENEYHVIVGGNLAAQINQQEYPENFTFHVLDKRPAVSLINWCRKMRWFDRLASEIRPDCVVASGGHGYWTPAGIPVISGYNIPHYIYPESPFFKSQSFRKRMYWKVKKYIDFHFFDKIDALFVQTDDVRTRLESKLKRSKIYTISNTLHPAFSKAHDSGSKNLLPEHDDRIRLLTVSACYPHKNLESIPKVLGRLRDLGRSDLIFVVTLRDEDFQRIFPACYRDSILNVGPQPIAKVPELYRECDFMFLPTLLECFSASYAEAMAMKKPILTSNMGFAHTVCKDAALYFDPMSPDDITKKILDLASSRDLQAQLVAKGNERLMDFGNSENRARQILRICREVIESRER